MTTELAPFLAQKDIDVIIRNKERIAKIVKQMNHENKKKQKAKRPKTPLSKQKNKTKCKPVRFPGI